MISLYKMTTFPMTISNKLGLQVSFLYFLKYSLEHQIKLYMYAHLCLLVV